MKVVNGLAKHLGRASGQWDQRFLVLCDSQAVIGACCKMRSSSFGLLRQLCAIAAIYFSTGVRLALRWVPSERNRADNPSRGRAVEKAAPETKPAATSVRPPELQYHDNWHL